MIEPEHLEARAGMTDPARATHSDSKAAILTRGLAKRCPRCGKGGLFSRWTEMADACPRCGLVFEQEEGYWVGALTINTMVSLVLFSLVITVYVVATWPDTPVLLAIVFGSLAAIVFPFLFYPFSKTLWVALDLALFNPWRMEPGTGLRRSR
jgi:uncharacterized protein (DUF983 family)